MGLCFHRALPGTATHRQGLHQAGLGFRRCPQLAGGAFTSPPGPATCPAWPYPGGFKRRQAKRRKPAAQSGCWLPQGPPFWQLSHPTVVYAKEQPEPVKGGETDGLPQGHPLAAPRQDRSWHLTPLATTAPHQSGFCYATPATQLPLLPVARDPRGACYSRAATTAEQGQGRALEPMFGRRRRPPRDHPLGGSSKQTLPAAAGSTPWQLSSRCVWRQGHILNKTLTQIDSSCNNMLPFGSL